MQRNAVDFLRVSASNTRLLLFSLFLSASLPAQPSFSAPNPARDQVVARAKQLMDTELLALSDDITRHPEIGFEEYRSVKLLIESLEKHGFQVTQGVGTLKTAFVGRWKGNRGAPNLGVILEYDALRGAKGAFHGDQHSAQGPVGIAAAVAIAEYLDRSKLPGSVTVFGTPGEEMMPPEAKTEMFHAGAFTGMDIIVRTTRPAPPRVPRPASAPAASTSMA